MAAGRGLRTIILGALLLLAGAALGIGAAAVRDGAAYAGRIYPGVAIGGIAVGGLSPDEAMAQLRPIVERRLRSPLVVRLVDRDATFTYADVGLRGRPEEAVQTANALGRTGSLWQRARSRVVLARR